MSKFSWGKLAAKVSGLKDWREHDGSKTWDDAGDAERLLADFLPKMQSVIGENVKLGVAEYAASGNFALSVREGALWVDLRISNDKSDLVVTVPIRDLLNKAIADAFPAIAANQSAQEFISLVAGLGKDINKLTSTLPGIGHNSGNVGSQMGGRIARKEAV